MDDEDLPSPRLPPTVLTPAQVAHWDAFGFVVLRGHFNSGSQAALQADVDQLHTAARGGAPYDASVGGRQAYEPLFEMEPSMHHWLDDERFYGLAVDLLGPSPILNASEGNRHAADTHWHAGSPDEEPPTYTQEEYRGNVKIAWCKPLEFPHLPQPRPRPAQTD